MKKYLTVDYICATCGFKIRVKTEVPKGKEHHALYYRQAIGDYKCFKCEQKKCVENCICGTCQTGKKFLDDEDIKLIPIQGE